MRRNARYSAGLSRAEAETLVLFLCWRAKVKGPVVDWSAKHTRGQQSNVLGKSHVAIGPRMHGDTVAAIIHEVAHHVVHARAPKLTKAERKRFYFPGLMTTRYKDRVHHGLTFVATLVELARYWYGDPALYPWGEEYKTVAAGARRELES